jgi:hypothetical protein
LIWKLNFKRNLLVVRTGTSCCHFCLK